MMKKSLFVSFVLTCMALTSFAGFDWVDGSPGTTVQRWDFTRDGYLETPILPEYAINEYGDPFVMVSAYPGKSAPQWCNGIWQGADAFDILLYIPNQPIQNPYKRVWFEFGFKGEVALATFVDPVTANAYRVGDPIESTDGQWQIRNEEWRIEPNPDYESFCFAFRPSDCGPLAELDYVEVHTICVPEPISILILGLGGVLIKRK